MVSVRPVSRSTTGFQPRRCQARVMSGRRCLGSSTGRGWKVSVLLEPVRRTIRSANSLIVSSFGLPMLTGSWKSLCESLKMPSIRSETEAEAARLAAVAEDGDRLALERLADEGGNDAAVLEPHARAVGVEDADDLGVDLVIAMIGHRHRLGEALGLVVDAARPDGIDVAPVFLGLRMDERIAVAFRGRGEEEARRPWPWPGRARCACRASRPSASGSAARDNRSGWPARRSGR